MRSVLAALGLIALGLMVFVGTLSPFISMRLLSVLMWQFVAVGMASFFSCLVTASISPRNAWALVGPVIVGGIVIFLWEGTRHFIPVEQLSSLPRIIPLWLLLGLACGVLGAKIGAACRHTVTK